MKKIVAMVCAAALLTVAGCKKDEPAPAQTPDEATPTENPTDNPPAPASSNEGLYAPAVQIERIDYSGLGSSQVWTWSDGHLMSVGEETAGGTNVRATFSYRTDGRVASIERGGTQLSGTVSVDYSGSYIQSLTLRSNGEEMVSAQLSHNSAHKVSGADLDLADEYLLGIFNTAVANVLETLSDEVDLAPELEGAQASLGYTWSGENVRTARLNVTFRVSTTLGAVKQMLGDLSMFGDMSQMLDAFPDRTPIYFDITNADTATFTYDQHANPLRHYLGALEEMITLDVSPLSANNVLTVAHTGAVGVAIVASYGGYEVPLLNRSYPLPDNDHTYTLSYTPDGYPETVIDNGSSTTTYTYKQ